MKVIKLLSGVFEYDPFQPLGRVGGFGQVFAGRTKSGTEVAIKKLNVSAVFAHRELRIADELKGLTLEHVLPVIDAGEDADSGDYFVVMPRADRTLQDKVDREGVFDAALTSSVLLQIAKGLVEVGILVHRDLKPENVLWHDNAWKVADFGIARFFEEATDSNTLKNCLSPFYAAPEQWRFERATHATDIYALGCIGFYLLTGKPPFIVQPEIEHQKEALPAFDCTDDRLKALINNMVRKVPATRPAVSRVVNVLNEIASKPKAVALGYLSMLEAAGAQVAEKEQQAQAKLSSERSEEEARKSLAEAAFDILSDNAERLWGKVSSHAPNAHRDARRGDIFACCLGIGSLVINTTKSNYHPAGVFKESGWDVVCSSQVLVTQERPPYVWSASLWYAKLRGQSDYRWYEVSYWTFGESPEYEPYACSDFRDADYAASASATRSILHSVRSLLTTRRKMSFTSDGSIC